MNQRRAPADAAGALFPLEVNRDQLESLLLKPGIHAAFDIFHISEAIG
jgi:hypothetical protein